MRGGMTMFPGAPGTGFSGPGNGLGAALFAQPLNRPTTIISKINSMIGIVFFE